MRRRARSTLRPAALFGLALAGLALGPAWAGRPPVPRLATVAELAGRDRAIFDAALATAPALELEVAGRDRPRFVRARRTVERTNALVVVIPGGRDPAQAHGGRGAGKASATPELARRGERDVTLVEVWIDPAGESAARVTLHARRERYAHDDRGVLVRLESERLPAEEERFLAALRAALAAAPP